MNANHQIKIIRPVSASKVIGPKSQMEFRVTITTDGTWFTIHGDKKDDVGFDLHFSTDGSNADLRIHTEDANALPPNASNLRLYTNRPA